MLYFLGLIFMAMAGVLSIPIPVAFIFGETGLIPFFLAPAIFSFIVGYILYWKYEEEDIRFGKAMVLVAVAWIILALLGSIPYIFTSNLGLLDSYFESMSGFTATGLTVMQGPAGWTVAEPPHTILFWRSLTQWVGGLGVIVLFLAVFPGTAAVARKLYASEAREGRIMPSMRGTARVIWKIYLLFTILGVLGLLVTGMGLFPSINHSMTGIATGGFSVTPDSFAGYGAPILVITLIIMAAGAISFTIHQKVMGGNWRALLRSPEVKLMVLLIILATVALTWSAGLKDALFEATSAITGTGFSSTGLIPANWEPFQKSVLTVLMVVGGGYGSTSSAIKLIRTITIIGAVYWLIKRSFLPDRAVVPLKIGGQVYSERDIMESATYAFIYIILLVAGSLLTMLLMPMSQFSGVDAVFESASAQGNVGLSVGLTAAANAGVKVLFIIQMLAGRLEIIPVAAFLGYIIGKIPRRRKAF